MQPHDRSGFTLIEMMITVAIIGILAAIAVPSFALFQARSRRAESYTNLSAIARSEEAYFAEAGSFVSTGGSWPGNTSEREKWDAASEAAFGGIGWRPEGVVYYDYAVEACAPNRFTASAYGDVDFDNLVAVVMLARPDPAGNDCPDAVFLLPPPIVDGAPLHDQPVTWPELAGSAAY